jgi:L-rhamnose isomerase
VLLTLDAGHYHPTESMADKLSAVLLHLREVLLHVSRGVRWDSDHVVTLDDSLRDIAREIVVNGFLSRVHIGLDYFDASINRIAAWVIGVRNMQKALLIALLEPTETLRQLELSGNLAARLAVQEELKMLPAGAIWDQFCHIHQVPLERDWMTTVECYEKDVLSRRAGK